MSSFILWLLAFLRRSQPESSSQTTEVQSSTPIGEDYFLNNPGPVVYLLQHGDRAEFKIGCTKDVNARMNGIGLLMPEPIYLVHCIYTNDPEWLEKIWHKHFAHKRKMGSGKRRASEWFDLSSADVDEFKKHREWNNPAISFKPQLQLPLERQEPHPAPPIAPLQLKGAPIPRVSEVEAAKERVKSYFDNLKKQFPDQASRLMGAYNFQISQMNSELTRMRSNGLSDKEAIAQWEERACRSANKKIE